MSCPELDLFGEIFVKNIKDETVDTLNMALDGKLRMPDWQGIMSEMNKLAPDVKDLIRNLVICCISYGMHDFLLALNDWNDTEDGNIKVTVNGKDLIVESPDLQGELLGEDGWEKRFSDYDESNTIFKEYNSIL